VPITPYTGGGPNEGLAKQIAVGAVSVKETENASHTATPTKDATPTQDVAPSKVVESSLSTATNTNVSANVVEAPITPTIVSAPIVTVTPVNATIVTASPVVTEVAKVAPINEAPLRNAPSESAPKKQISLNGHKLTIGPPWNLSKGSKETEALAWFGVDKTTDTKLKEEVLQALYDGVCDTDKPLIMVLECEPLRRLVQSLAEKLLGQLTKPIMKKPANAIKNAVRTEKQSITLMTVNIFQNLC
jgi:hypothetical protein